MRGLLSCFNIELLSQLRAMYMFNHKRFTYNSYCKQRRPKRLQLQYISFFILSTCSNLTPHYRLVSYQQMSITYFIFCAILCFQFDNILRAYYAETMVSKYLRQRQSTRVKNTQCTYFNTIPHSFVALPYLTSCHSCEARISQLTGVKCSSIKCFPLA